MTPEPLHPPRRRPISLTLRVLLFVTAAIGLSLLLNATLVLRSIQHHFAEQDVGELNTIAHSMQALLARGETGLHDALLPLVSGHHGVDYQLQDASGTLLYAPGTAGFADPVAHLPAVSQLRPDNLSNWQRGERHYRGGVVALRVNGETYRLTLAVDMDFHLHFLQNFRHSLWLIMLATGVLTLLAAAFAVYQGHLPLRGLSQRMREIQTSRLDVRLDAGALPAELRELAHSFNQMIGRLQQGFDQLAHYSSDIAHELRTPLTSLITQTQVTLSKPRDTDTYRELLYSSLEELERLSKLVGDMLWLAKSDNQLLQPQLQPLQLADEVQELFDFFEALAAEKHITLQCEGHAPAVAADRTLLRRAISNLLSNALRHTPDGQYVNVVLEQVSDGGQPWATLSVINPGEGIAAGHLPHLFERFYRVDPSRQRHSDGAGLGLAIARSIVQAHAGDIRVTSAAGKTCFRLRLPLAGQ